MSFSRQAAVVVIGAGPAGLSAALAAREAGAEVLVLDEYAQPGGQFYKQLPAAFRVPDRARLDPDYTKGDALIARVRDRGVEILQDTLVWASFDAGELSVTRQGTSGTVRYESLVVATGAYERVVAFPGWDLPGVMTPGGAQTLVKNQRVLPGKRIVLAGSGPFLLPVAKTLLGAGAHIVAMVEATRPRAWARHAARLWGHGDRVHEALDYRRIIRDAGVPIRFGALVVEAHGGECLERVLIRDCDRDGHVAPHAPAHAIEADVLCVGYGFVPGTQVTRLLGCAHRHDVRCAAQVPVHDDRMQTSVAGVFVAGEVAGIGGAHAAAAEGKLAGLAAAQRLGRAIDPAQIATAQRDRAHHRRFAALINDLFPLKPAYFDAVRDDTIVCRCEEVSAGDVRAALAAWGADLNCVKGVTRCGMGYCQGRMCGPTVAALAVRGTGAQAGDIEAMSVRAPIKPVTVATLAELDAGQ